MARKTKKRTVKLGSVSQAITVPAGPALTAVQPTITSSISLADRWRMLPQRTKYIVYGGAAAVVLVALFRKPIASGVVTAAGKFGDFLSSAQVTVLRKFVPKGREGYVNAAFEVGKRTSIDPWLLIGILRIEGNFGAALTAGSAFGQTVFTGDFIPRPAMKTDKNGNLVKTSTTIALEKNPLPGCKRVQWKRPKIGNLPEYEGEMWVPAHDLRVAKYGLPGAYTKNGGIEGGVGWGFTPWQLDWASFAPQLAAGAAWVPAKATEVATTLIKKNIDTLKRAGLSGSDLIQAVVAAYNAGSGGIVKGLKDGKTLNEITAGPGYVTKALQIANEIGHKITV